MNTVVYLFQEENATTVMNEDTDKRVTIVPVMISRTTKQVVQRSAFSSKLYFDHMLDMLIKLGQAVYVRFYRRNQYLNLNLYTY